MPDDLPAPESARQKGYLLACEGILRSQFGRRPSRAANRAVEQLRREEANEAIVPFPSAERSRRNPLRPALALAAGIALLIGLSIWLFPPTNNQPILVLSSAASATIERGTEIFPARDQMNLQPRDVLRATSTNPATISYGNEPTSVALNDGAELKILPWTKGKRFELRRGKLEAVVARQRPWKLMVLLTAQAEAQVVGTKFTLAVTTNATRLEVTEGKVKFMRMSDSKAAQVDAGHYVVASSNYALVSQPIPGKVLREYWLDLPGDTLQDLTYHARYPNASSGHDFPVNFETSTNWPGAFGTRTRGYVLPPVSGDYEFRISGNGQMGLWLSPDDDPTEKGKVAQIAFTRNRPGDDAPEQTRSLLESGPIPLEAGRCYYIEAVRKYGAGEDHFSITWKRPDGTVEPIPSEFLAPFVTKKGAKK